MKKITGHAAALKKIEEYKKKPSEDKSLDLSHLELKSIPFEVKDLTDLKIIDLSGNQITEITNCSNLVNLAKLYLHDNSISEIKNIENLINLSNLNLNRNHISEIENIENLVNLRLLDLEGNRISEIKGLESNVKLVTLVLSRNQISEIKGLESNLNLKFLNLSSNQISEIKNLESLIDLSGLYLISNNITEIENLENLKNLENLNLGDNQIYKIENLENLKILKILYLSNNQISKIENLEYLLPLTSLYLEGNQIKNIVSIEKSQLNWLSNRIGFKLRIDNNPFLAVKSNIKVELYSTEGNANHYNVFLSDLRRAIEFKDDVELAESDLKLPKKMLLLGNSAAGKTTFCDNLINPQSFADLDKDSTEVLSIHEWPLNKDKDDIAYIYDFGGQDFYHGTYQMFLSTESLYVVIWDKNTNHNKCIDKPTDKRPDPYINYDLRYWVSNIEYLTQELVEIRKWEIEGTSKEVQGKNVKTKDKSEKIISSKSTPKLDPIILVENKIDISLRSPIKKVDLSSVNCKDQFRISLLKSPNNVTAYKERRHLLRTYVQEELGSLHSDESFAPIHHKIIAAFLNTQKNVDFKVNSVPLSDFHKMIFGSEYPEDWKKLEEEGKDHHIEELRLALRLMHNRGLLLYYYDETDLKDDVFINPAKVLVDIKREIITKGGAKDGKLRKSDIQKIDSKLLALAINQQIIFDNSISKISDEYYIIPAYLKPSNKYNLLYKFSTSRMKPMFSLQFSYFLPYGMMNRVICGFGKEPHEKLFYKDEIIFTIEENEHMWIKCDPVKLRIDVWSTLSSNDKSSVDEYMKFVYRILMAAYYRIPTLDWKRYSQILKNKINPLVAIDKITEEDHSKNPNVWEELERFERAFYLKDEIFAPNDLNLSVDGEYFVSLEDIKAAFDEKSTTTILTGVSTDTEGIKSTTEVKRHVFNAFMPRNILAPKKVFISYAHDDVEYREELNKYLINLQRTDQIEIWQDGLIHPGEDWNEKILSKLREADWIIMLISQSFISSNYIYEKELKIALEKVKDGTRIIPILLSNCDWQNWKAYPKSIADKLKETGNEIFENLKVANYNFLPLNENGRPKAIKKWQDQEDAWTDITEALRAILEDEK